MILRLSQLKRWIKSSEYKLIKFALLCSVYNLFIINLAKPFLVHYYNMPFDISSIYG